MSVGILICIISLLPIVRNMLFSFVDTHTSGINFRTSGTFNSRLMSLLSLPFFGLIVFVYAICCLFSKSISAFLENTKNAKLITVLTVVIGVLLLGFVSIYSYQHGPQWINSDHSSEMVLGKLLADENTFVSRNWRYSTEIRLIYQTIFIMPLFKLLGHFGNWALIRALAILLNNLVLFLSYLFMVRQMKIQTKWICITSLFLILPISNGYWDIVTFGGFYIFFIAQFFCCLGLFIKLINHTETIKKTVPIDFILFTVLSFMLGVQGIRSPLCVHIPLLITCIFLYSKYVSKKVFPLFLGCYGFIVCCIGFAGNYLLHFKYNFYSFDTMQMENLFERFFPKLGESLISLPMFFGLSAGSHVLSAKGIFSVVSIIATVILFWAITKSLRQTKIYNEAMTKQVEYHFLSVFFIISVIINIFVFIVIDEKITSRYFIPFMVLYIPLTAMLFQYAEEKYIYLKRIAVITGIILFILGQSYLNFQNMAKWDRNKNRKGYLQYLIDNKLDYGFAAFWNANITTELTNGKIELAALDSDGLDPNEGKRFNIQGWLQPVNPSFHQGESFLLLTRAEWELAQKTERSFARLRPDYEDNDFIIIRFPSAEIIHREILDK
jgi:hypothetical protein